MKSLVGVRERQRQPSRSHLGARQSTWTEGQPGSRSFRVRAQSGCPALPSTNSRLV
jgi:hypothetical protein